MKTLEQIKEEAYNSLSDVFTTDFLDVLSNSGDIQEVINEIAKRYAIEVAKETQRLCVENARMKSDVYYCDCGNSHIDYNIDKQSILSENNLPKHI